MSVTNITTDAIRQMNEKEGLVLIRCGGDLTKKEPSTTW